MAQRLPAGFACGQGAPDEAELHSLGLAAAEQAPTLQRAQGCLQCAGTGYHGRVALYEVMPVEGRVRSLLGAPTEEIVAAAVEQGMTTVRQDGVRLCLEGVTSAEEVLRVVGAR